MGEVDSRDVNWTIIFIEAGTFNLQVNASGYYYGTDFVVVYESITITVLAREEHDLAVSLETPIILELDKSILLNATVYNVGLNNETDVELQLLINGSIADSTVIPELLTSSSHSIRYLWTPTIEGIYNITAYAPPVPGENIVTNNIKSAVISPPPNIVVVADDDALSSDGRRTCLLEFELALNEAGFDYFVWNETTMGNPPLEFLLKFKMVIWTCGDNLAWAVDPTDAETLQAYLSKGGTILLEGEDIGYDHNSDSFMVNVAHAIFQIDSTGAPGLTVTDPTHPVAIGLPTSFNWAIDPPFDDGVSPTNGGVAVINYTGTNWTAVTVFNGTKIGIGSVVYYAFPLYCLAQPERDTLVKNSVSWLLTLSRVQLTGDIDDDGDVDYDDLVVLAGAYGSSIGQPVYNPDADLDRDNDVDCDDLFVLARNYGKTTP